ncbi:MAG: hypothetical protein HBSAPP04_24540 [Ignavibacteriaceae bacterium]|nr:MAG: hypothetical protein HBSAPP04_24540 [Ignavibacteriaceae bacterium]
MLAEKWFAYKLFKIGRKISYFGSGYVALLSGCGVVKQIILSIDKITKFLNIK